MRRANAEPSGRYRLLLVGVMLLIGDSVITAGEAVELYRCTRNGVV
jgi:hypothetical protein